jgi:cell division protein FtsQ
MRTNQTDSKRAEQVRQLRSKLSQDKVKRAVKQVRYASEAPVVFTRGGFGTPVLNRAQSKVKRKVAIPLNSGAELQMPALPMVKAGWRMLSFILVCALSFAIYTVTTSPTFTVSEPEIFGIQRLTVNDIDVIAEIAGSPIFMVDPVEATANLKAAFPELSEVSVKIILPASVVIDVVERQPVLAWHYDQQTLWIDAEGAIFPARGELQGSLIAVSADIPPLLLPKERPAKTEGQAESEDLADSAVQSAPGSMVGRRVDPHMLNGIMALSQILPADTTLAFDQIHGMGWSDPAGWNVFIGSKLEDLDIKMAVYQKLVEKINQEEALPSIVSVAQVHAPYYRWEQ